MKKTIFTTLLVLTIYMSGTAPSYAIFCSNCSTWAQQLIDYARQGLQYAKDVSTDFSSGITATQQTLDTVNNRILIPMRDAMTVMTVMKSGDNMKNLILGSMGVEPLLVKDPELYFKNKALSSVQANLGVISGQNSIYSGSVLASLVSANRYNYADVSTKLKAINQSSIPSTVQKNVCEDASLSQLAQEDVLASSEDGTLDEAAFNDRKRELYRALCTGDPATNLGLATTLQKIGEQRPDLGGWDAWLAVTSGDNAYRKTVDSQLVIDQKVQEVLERAKNDYTMGGGIRSLTECKKYAEEDINGNLMGETSSVPCVAEDIKQTGSTLLKAYNDAIGAPLNLMLASFGKGAGGLINSAFTSINLIQGISSAMDSMSGSAGSSGGSRPNTTTTVVNTPPARDLASNPTAKETLSTPPKQQLLSHQDSLDYLDRTDRNYVAEIDSFQNRLATMKGCYDKLVLDYPQTQSDSRVTAAYSYQQSKTTSNGSLKTKLVEELGLIETTKGIISSALSTINSSQSSEEILAVFNSYQNQVDSQNLPNIMTRATREGEYATFKGENDQSVIEGGALHTHNNDCVSIRQQIETMNFNGAGM